MSSQALPVSAAVFAPRRASRPSGLFALDRRRLLRWQERREAGRSPLEAWADVVTDAEIGQRDYRGKNAVPPASLARSFAKFIERSAPAAQREAVAQARVEAALATTAAIHTLREIASGEFGVGTVTLEGRGDEKREVVKIDSAAAAVRVSAARAVLQVSGVLQNGSAGGGTNVQINNVNAAREANERAHAACDEIMEAAKRDPKILDLAIELSNRMAPQVPDAAENERPRTDAAWRKQ